MVAPVTSPPPTTTTTTVVVDRRPIVHKMAVFALVWALIRFISWFDTGLLRHLPFRWMAGVVLLVAASVAIATIAARRNPTAIDSGGISFSWLLAVVAAVVALSAPYGWVNDLIYDEGCKQGEHFSREVTPARCVPDAPGPVVTIPPVTSTSVPTGDGEWTARLYRTDPGTPDGYFGIAVEECKPGVGTIERCLQEIDKTLKGDYEILATKLRSFNLLDDFHGMSASEYEKKTPAEVEVLRQQAAEKLKDVNQRKLWQPRVMDQYRSLGDLKLVGFSGPMHSEYTDSSGARHQIQKNMDPSVNYGLQGKRPDGSTYSDKADCHFQEVSPTPLKKVPPKPTPTTLTPPGTQPPVTSPPVTQPPVTQPPVTQPPVTSPPVTSPPVTQPPGPTTTVKDCSRPGICGTPTAGPDVNPRVDPGRTPGVVVGTNEQAQQQQQTTAPAATSGSVATPYGVDTGSYNNNNSTPPAIDTVNPSTPPSSNAGISNPPTAPPNSGQTSGAPTCDPSSC